MSMVVGFVSLLLTTRSAPRVVYCLKYGIGVTFRTASQAASVIGFGVASINLLSNMFSNVVFAVAIEIYKEWLGLANSSTNPNYFRKLFEAVAGYGLGSSLVALITRVGGGMFEAATETGSNLVGKTEGALPFSHTRNAATVALHAGRTI